MPLISFDITENEAHRPTRNEKICAIIIIVAGFAIRGYASIYSMGIVHADEHQQYMEQGNRIAYGYGETFWEQHRGMRNFLYPGILAGFLLTFDALGISDPIAQAALIRMILASALFLVLIAIAWQCFREGRRAMAAFFLAWVSLSPFMAFLSVRTLSETVMIGPFFLALLLLPRRPGLAGLLLALSFAIRFQAGILMAVVVGLLLVECLRDSARWRKMAYLIVGLSLGLFALGWLDLVTLGSWFHSPINYFGANIWENKSAEFGVKPWFYYPEGIANLFMSFPLAGLCFAIGAFREWRIAIISLVFIAVHSAIGHKEPRFIWTLVPVAYLLTAAGVQVLWNSTKFKTGRIVAVGVLVFSIAWVEYISFPNILWNRQPFGITAHALAKAGKHPDATGVAVFGSSRYLCGNYFYLRRPIPLIVQPNLNQLLYSLEERHDINTLIAKPNDITNFAKWRPLEVERVGIMSIYLLHRSEKNNDR